MDDCPADISSGDVFGRRFCLHNRLADRDGRKLAGDGSSGRRDGLLRYSCNRGRCTGEMMSERLFDFACALVIGVALAYGLTFGLAWMLGVV